MERLFDETVEVQRLSDDAVGKSYQTHIASLDCTIQPFDDESTEGLDNTFGKDYKLYCKNVDIIEDDRIIRDGNQFDVIGVETYTQGRRDHLKVLIRGD